MDSVIEILCGVYCFIDIDMFKIISNYDEIY